MAGCKIFSLSFTRSLPHPEGLRQLRAWVANGLPHPSGLQQVQSWVAKGLPHPSGLQQLRALAAGLLLLLPLLSAAQIRIVPESELLEASSPRLCADSSALAFDRKTVELNDIAEDSDPVEIRFRVRNVSDKSISVVRLAASCPCVSLSMAKTRLSPSEETVLSATYNPEGHPGQFRRKIFLYTEASEKHPAAVLEIRARVSWTGVGGGEYPYSAGTLLLRRKSLTLKAGTTESVRCFNPSDKPLKIGADLSFVPWPLGFECIPPVLAPGSEGRLVFRFPEPAPAARDTLGTYPVILKGCDARPLDSTLKITLIHS